MVDKFFVKIERQQNDRFWIRYHVEAPAGAIKLGVPARPVRRDELWKGTCFETFVKRPDGDGYLEFNFAPSSAWAAYSFTGYREGMADLAMKSFPKLNFNAGDDHFALEVVFKLNPKFADQDLLFGMAAVIEEQGGAKSYWSLAHRHGAPDFHHPDCFTLHFPAVSEL